MRKGNLRKSFRSEQGALGSCVSSQSRLGQALQEQSKDWKAGLGKSLAGILSSVHALIGKASYKQHVQHGVTES